MGRWDGSERRQEPTDRLILEVPLSSNFDVVLRLIASALKGGGTDSGKLDAVIEMLRNLAPVPAELALVKEELSIIHGLTADMVNGPNILLTAINNLDGKVNAMSSNLDRIEKEAADAAANVELVRTAVDGLNTIAAEMKAEIASLKEQVAQGQLDQARLDAAASTFEKADDDIDAIVLPAAPPPVEPPVEG